MWMSIYFRPNGKKRTYCFYILHKLLNAFWIVQVEKPSYRLILKKEKAHVMDINCVRWCPQVTYENSQQKSLNLFSWRILSEN